MQIRKLALLGGTTRISDCFYSLIFILFPFRLIKGKSIRKYERKFADFIGCKYGISFGAGRIGLFGLLKALHVKNNDEILLQVPTHIVVVNAIKYSGAKPVFVDCEPDTCNISVEDLKKKISKKSKILVLQHTFGIPNELESIMELAEKYGIYVLEDCVHSLGSQYKNKQLGRFGIASFYSSEETKTISTTMGGVVVTDNERIASELKKFQDNCLNPSINLIYRHLLKLIVYHFLTFPYVHGFFRSIYEALGKPQPMVSPTTIEERSGKKPVSYEIKMSNAQAFLGIRQLERINQNIKHRKRIAKIFEEVFSRKDDKTVFKVPQDSDTVYVRFPILVEDKLSAVEAMSRFVVLGQWFTSVLEEADSLNIGDYVEGMCTNAEFLTRHLVNLPTHPRVKITDAYKMAEAILPYLINVPNNE